MLPATFFQRNRHELKQLADGLIVVTANGLLQRSGDTTFPFRQDSNFYYLTGLSDLADAVLVMVVNEEFLILPKRTEAEIIFGGAIDCDELAKISGIKKIYDYTEGWERYKKLQKSRKKIYTLGAAPQKIAGADSFFTNPARRALIQKVKRISSAKIEDIRLHLVALRQIKQPEEIGAIKKAIAITKEGFQAARKSIKIARFEYEVAAEFDYTFAKLQANHGYQPIVASGKNACILHYIKNNAPLSHDANILLDVGAEFQGYSADITRTYPVTAFTTRQKQVYEAVYTVQQQAMQLLKPGLQWREYAKSVEQCMGEQLMKLGLISEPTRDAIRHYFPHGISHSLGLDVHDVCDYETLQENMVITVEPGIYIPEEGIGVRIEDNVLVTKTGAVNLSEDIAYE